MSKCEIPKTVVENNRKSGLNLGDAFNKAANIIILAQDVAAKNKMFSKVFATLQKGERDKYSVAHVIREVSLPYEKLSKQELDGLVKIQIEGDSQQRRFTPDELKSFGLNDAQIEAYNGYSQATTMVFESVNRANIENIKRVDKELGATQEEALDSFIDIANNSHTKEEMKSKIDSYYESIQDRANAKEIRNSMNNMAKDYIFGYMVRNRGEGGHFIEIMDSNGKLIHKEKVSALDLLTKKDELFARAKDNAQKNLEQRRITEGKALDRTSAKYLEYRQKAMEKMTPKAFEYLAKLRDGNEDNIKIGAGDEKDFKLAQQMFRRDTMLNNIMKQREINQTRTLNEPTSREIKAEEISTGTNPFITIEHINNAMKAEIGRFKRKIEAKKDMTPQEKAEAIANKQLELDGTFGAMKLALEKEAQGRTFKRHKMKRASEFISGVNYDNPQIDLVHYIQQGSQASANIKTQADAYSALSDLKESGAGDYGFAKKLVEDWLSPESDISKVSGKIGALNFAQNFAGNVGGAVVNTVGNFGNATAAIAKEGFGVAGSNTMYMKHFSKASGMVSQYILKKLSDPSYSFGEFVKSYDGFKDPNTKKLIDRAITEGLAFDINVKEFGSMSELKNKAGMLYKAATSPVTLTERINRIASILSAAEMASKNQSLIGKAIKDNRIIDTGDNFENLVAYTDYISGEINGIYGKLGRNYISSGNATAPSALRAVYPFLTYNMHQMLGLYPKYLVSSIHSAHAMFKKGEYTPEEMKAAADGAKAFLNLNMWQLLVGGIGGNIGLSYVMDAYDMVEEWATGVPSTGFVSNIKTKEDAISTIAGYGVPGLFGIDVTGSTSIQTPYISGSYLFGKYNQSDTMEQFSRGNYVRGVVDNMFAPATIKSIAQAIYDYDIQTKVGQPIQLNGKTIERTQTEAIMHMLRLKPADISKSKEAIRIRKDLDSWIANEKKKFNEDYSHNELDTEQYEDFKQIVNVVNEIYGTKYKTPHPRMGEPSNYEIYDEEED